MKCLVVGDLMLDIYLTGDVSRLSPEAPVPIVDITGKDFRLGAAANVARNLSQLGFKVDLYGVIGDDEYGDLLKSLITAAGVKLLNPDNGRPTTVKTRVIGNRQQIVRLDEEIKAPYYGENEAVIEQGKYDMVVISDYAKGVMTGSMIARIKGMGIKTIIDPKPPLERYSGFYALKPNAKEFDAFGLSPQEAFAILQVEVLFITRGKDGIEYVSRDEKAKYHAEEVEVFDVTGAGDTVTATIVWGMSKDFPLDKVAQIANKAGAESCKHVGCYTISLGELKRFAKEVGA
jgi:D-beta-D-heptose 7-phosphate kinase/D-beta-D-heptose 1-phosphate adenosyltransferase